MCDDCAHGRESRRYAEISRKRPPKRRAAVEALRVVTGDVDTETKEDVEEKEEEEDSDSGSDFDTDDEDDDEDDDDDDILGMMDATELDLNSLVVSVIDDARKDALHWQVSWGSTVTFPLMTIESLRVEVDCKVTS